MNKKYIKPYISQMEKLDVSNKARSKEGFLHNYLNTNFDDNKETKNKYMKKRKLFLTRTIPAFDKNPTYRRFLSLIAWAYMPFENVKNPINSKNKFNNYIKRKA